MIIVAGGSLGGLRAAEQLRAHGYTGPIRVIGDEIHPPYNRPPLSKEFLAAPGTDVEARARLAFRQRASTVDVQWSLGVRVEASNLAENTIRLGTGEEIRYEGLVVATGLRPRRLGILAPARGRVALRTIEDSLALREHLREGSRVVVVGAGFIGCEVAATAIRMGCTVTVVEGMSGPMQRSLGSELSRSMKNFMESRGALFHPGRRVLGLLSGPQGACAGVILDDGTELAADVVVEAIGSDSNVEWLEGNNLDLSDGVLCDDQMRVQGTQHVVAVGDIARYPDLVFGGAPRRVEHWATPGDTAKIAASTLLADLSGLSAPELQTPLPSFWTDLFGVRLFGIGSPGIATSERVLEGDIASPDQGLALGYYRDDLLVAAVTVGLAANRQLHYRTLVTAARDRFRSTTAH